MFTGIIKAIGCVDDLQRQEDQARFVFSTGALDLSKSELGDSIAVNGVCLTLTKINNKNFIADLSRETLKNTTFSELSVGDPINIEPALVLGDSLDGHLVSGHVDAVGKVLSVNKDGESLLIDIDIPNGISHYIARKGSICVDGVSLTVNGITEQSFTLTIVPHTLESTIISNYRVGTKVNLEVDIIARYLERFGQSAEN
ncbi:MAG: riboflavin synthase [Pseudomonadota bacterium]|nr:riboflavin synthase [Pseudomonadota bacterium]